MTYPKVGDYVRILINGVYFYGEVTLKKGIQCKVLFPDLPYDYYPEHQLEIVNLEDVKDYPEQK